MLLCLPATKPGTAPVVVLGLEQTKVPTQQHALLQGPGPENLRDPQRLSASAWLSSSLLPRQATQRHAILLACLVTMPPFCARYKAFAYRAHATTGRIFVYVMANKG